MDGFHLALLDHVYEFDSLESTHRPIEAPTNADQDAVLFKLVTFEIDHGVGSERAFRSPRAGLNR